MVYFSETCGFEKSQWFCAPSKYGRNQLYLLDLIYRSCREAEFVFYSHAPLEKDETLPGILRDTEERNDTSVLSTTYIYIYMRYIYQYVILCICRRTQQLFVELIRNDF